MRKRAPRFTPEQVLLSRPIRNPSLATEPAEAAALTPRIDELQSQQTWPVQREKLNRGRSRSKALDLREFVEKIELIDGTLKITAVRRGDAWARPGEVLELLGLDGRVDLARLRRVRIEYEFSAPLPTEHDSRDDAADDTISFAADDTDVGE